MIERLEAISNRYNEINEELNKSETLTDIKKTLELNKEQASLKDAFDAYQKYQTIINDIEAANEMLKDPEMGEFAKEELSILTNEKEQIEKTFEILLLPKDPYDGKNVIIEIRGAAGGDEANIFAGDLFRMYTRYAESEGWKVEVYTEEHGTSGGYTQVEFLIKGDNVYSKFKYESGAHRVQRVPETETQGRVHTSTSTVLVMPEADEIDSELDMNDVKVDVTRSSGVGGQSVNTTDSAVRLTHVPTGIVVYSQTERSQLRNKEKAIKLLQTRLYNQKIEERDAEVGVERRSKIGTGDRSEKIRTYNYPQQRVTDHRIGFTTKQLYRVMEGDMSEIIDALIHEDQTRKLQGE